MSRWSWQLVGLILAGLELSSCRSRPKAPVVPPVEVYITRDERVDDWRLDGVENCPGVLRVPVGCYVLEAKFEESYTRVHGASSLWGISWAAAALDTATRIHSSKYETDYVPFAVTLRPGHRYYVTATFDGDVFSPRIVELNANAERTLEVLPAASVDEVKACKALDASAKEGVATVCAKSGTRR